MIVHDEHAINNNNLEKENFPCIKGGCYVTHALLQFSSSFNTAVDRVFHFTSNSMGAKTYLVIL